MTVGPFEQRRVWSGAVEEAELNRIVTQIAERLASRHEEIVRHVTGVIASGIDDLDDPKAADLLLSSVDANMQAIMHACRRSCTRCSTRCRSSSSSRSGPPRSTHASWPGRVSPRSRCGAPITSDPMRC